MKKAKRADEVKTEIVPEKLALKLPDDPNKLTKERVDLITQTVAKGATPTELKMFLLIAQRTGLDPFMKQIYYVKRYDSRTGGETGTIQVGIDGLRATAEKTGEYAGSDEPIFDEAIKTPGKAEDRYPIKATVTVYRIVQGQKVGFTASARWSEYFPGEKQGFMWRKMPYNMLGKCAESLALRKAFPMAMSGLYVHEEMQQANKTAVVVNPTPETATPETPTPQANSMQYNKAIELIQKENDPVVLSDYKVKLSESNLYDADQKGQLTRLIDARINSGKTK